MSIEGTISNWFPVQILEINAPQFISVGKLIFQKINWELLRDPLNYNENAETTYHSGHALPEVNGIYEFGNLITLAAEQFAKSQGVDISKKRAVIVAMWMSNMRSGSTHAKHAHGLCMYAGTYYVECPSGSGNIRFHNPSSSLMGLVSLPVTQDDNPATSNWVDFKPQPGRLLLWNSWVYHEVIENRNITPRITISFNVNLIDR